MVTVEEVLSVCHSAPLPVTCWAQNLVKMMLPEDTCPGLIVCIVVGDAWETGVSVEVYFVGWHP